MWDNTTITMLLEGTRDTLYMTLVSTFFGYVLGLPLGILLAVTDKEGIHPNAVVYKVLDVLTNIFRSIPFLILLILVIPLTKLIVGTELWLQCNNRTACDCSGSVHCPYGGIFAERSGTGSARGSSQYGRRNTDDHLESSSCRSKNFSSCRSNNRRRNNSWLFRYGRNCWWRRTWRYRYSLWILPLSDRHHDHNDCNSGSACADPAGTWHDALQEAG